MKNAVPSPSTNVAMELTHLPFFFFLLCDYLYYIRFPKLMDPISVESEKRKVELHFYIIISIILVLFKAIFFLL